MEDCFVNVTFKADENCQVLCDGDFLVLLDANQITKEKAPAGNHVLTFISVEDESLSIEKHVSFPELGKSYLVLANDFISLREEHARLKEEQARRMIASTRIPYTLFGLRGTCTLAFKDIRDGKPWGEGKWESDDKHLVYEGQLGYDFNHGELFRDGELIYRGTVLTDGTYHDEKANAKYPEGWYHGAISRGVRSGKGEMCFNNKERYDGEWENDLPNGEGTLYTNFIYEYYTGSWSNGLLVSGKHIKSNGWGKDRSFPVLRMIKIY